MEDKYRSGQWQENTLKQLYYAFGTSEEEGLKLFLNLVFEYFYTFPSFLEKLYHTINEIKEEGIYEVTGQTLDWVEFWRSFDNSDNKKNPAQRAKLYELKDKKYLSSNNLGRLNFHLGFIESKMQNIKIAVENYEASIRLLPNWSWTRHNLGKIYYDLGKTEEAISEYKKAIELDPKFASPIYNLGIIYSDLGMTEEAISEYKKAIELDPKFAYPHNGLGKIYSDLGKTEEAISAYKKAIELDPKNATPHNGLGYLSLTRGKLVEARIYFEKAITLDSGYYDAHINLGITYFKLGKNDAAKLHFQSMLEKCPLTSSYGRLNKITALLGLENPEEALTLFQQTCEQFEIPPREKNEFLNDWNMLATSPHPPLFVNEFLNKAKVIFSSKAGK